MFQYIFFPILLQGGKDQIPKALTMYRFCKLELFFWGSLLFSLCCLHPSNPIFLFWYHFYDFSTFFQYGGFLPLFPSSHSSLYIHLFSHLSSLKNT